MRLVVELEIYVPDDPPSWNGATNTLAAARDLYIKDGVLTGDGIDAVAMALSEGEGILAENASVVAGR